MERERFGPVDAQISPRFVGIRTFMRLPHIPQPENVDVAIIGIPFDTGVTFRVGSRFGPSAIRENSLLLRPYHPVHDVEIFEYVSAVDAGDINIVPGFTEDSFERVEHALTLLLETSHAVPIVLGGDHSIALPDLRVLAKRHGPLALIHFDAHLDTWDQYWGHRYTHGTPFRRAAEEGLLDTAHSIQVGIRGPLYSSGDMQGSRDLGFEILTTSDVLEHGAAWSAQRIAWRVGDRPAYISFDIDCVDPAFAPGTGTPEVGGFSSYQAQQLIRGLAQVNLVGFEMMEVLPQYDGPGAVTSLLAANLCWEFLALVALRKKRAAEEHQEQSETDAAHTDVPAN
jgi:agmatinase